MGASLKVFQSLPASEKMAGWLNRMLGPALTSCQFSGPWPPIELKPMIFGGLASSAGVQIDRRICLNSRAIFWQKGRVVHVALHEVAHRLVMEWEDKGADTEDHGPVFFLTLATLYTRAETAVKNLSGLMLDVTLYDFQSPPKMLAGLDQHEWMPEVLGWALKHAPELASSDTAAEELPEKAMRLWVEHANKINARRTALAKATAKIQHLQAALNEARESKIKICWSMYGGAVLAAMAGMMIYWFS